MWKMNEKECLCEGESLSCLCPFGQTKERVWDYWVSGEIEIEGRIKRKWKKDDSLLKERTE